MEQEVRRSNWRVENIYQATYKLLETQLDQLQKNNRTPEALELLGREGRKLLQPTNFYLGESVWTNGILLGQRRLSTRANKIIKIVLFDIQNPEIGIRT
jgi:hypothetical protein